MSVTNTPTVASYLFLCVFNQISENRKFIDPGILWLDYFISSVLMLSENLKIAGRINWRNEKLFMIYNTIFRWVNWNFFWHGCVYFFIEDDLLYWFWILFFQASQVSTETNANTSANKVEEKVGDGKYSSHSLDEVAGMIRGTVSAYEIKVNMLPGPFYLKCINVTVCW